MRTLSQARAPFGSGARRRASSTLSWCCSTRTSTWRSSTPPSLDAPALAFSEDPDAGDVGAAIGYPNGGPLTVTPGAVSTVIAEARGRNLYGDDTVTRRVIELRASIHRGNSGGPFVLEDGTVGGVVFAQARSDAAVAYALSPAVVAETIAPALDEIEDVATGPCVR